MRTTVASLGTKPDTTDFNAKLAIGRAPTGGVSTLQNFGPKLPIVLAFGLLAATQLIWFILSPNGALIAKTFTLGAQGLLLVIFELKRRGSPLTPLGVVASGSLLIWVMRPLTVASSGITSPGAVSDNRLFQGDAAAAAGLAASQVALFFSLLGLVTLALLKPPPSETTRSDRAFDPNSSLSLSATRWLLCVSLALSSLLTVALIRQSGGVAAHFAGLANRSEFLSGRFFYSLAYLPLVVAFVLHVLAARSTESPRTWNPLTVSAALALALIAFTTGGRGPVILGVILPLILLKQTGPRPLRNGSLLGLGAALIIGAVLMSIVLRENEYTNGSALRDLKENPTLAVAERLTNGSETRPFDSLILLNQVQENKPQRLYGLTYLKTLTWFLPSSIYDKKEGANAYFTRNYLPRFYYPNRVETSLSAPGEAFLNFGWYGLILSGCVFGWFLSSLDRTFSNSSSLHRLLGVIITPVSFSLMRGDAYQNISLTIVMIVLSCSMYAISVRSPKSVLASH